MANRPKTIEAFTALEDQAADAASKGFELTVSGLKDGMTRATAGFADTQAKVKEGMEKAMKTAEELMSFSQGNLEAMVKCGQIWAAGVQDIGKQLAANAQASFDETVSTFKALSSAKSLKDAFDLQASLARSTLEKTVAEFGQADRRFDEAHRAGAGAAHRPRQSGDGEVWQDRLIARPARNADGNCPVPPPAGPCCVEKAPALCRGLFSWS